MNLLVLIKLMVSCKCGITLIGIDVALLTLHNAMQLIACFGHPSPVSLMQSKKRAKKKQKIDTMGIVYDVITHHDEESAVVDLEKFFD